MALRLHSIVVLIFCATFATCVFGDNCKAYWDQRNKFYDYQQCNWGSYCCGTCINRKCCYNPLEKLSEDDQDKCVVYSRDKLNRDAASVGDNCNAYWDSSNKFHYYQPCNSGMHCCGTCNNRRCCFNPLEKLGGDAQVKCIERDGKSFSGSSSTPFVPVIVPCVIVIIVAVLISLCCCCCECCCLYSLCHKPRPVVATTHTTVVTSVPQHCPEQPTAVAGVPQPYQRPAQCPPYQPMPVQPGYGIQAMPTVPYQGQPFPPLLTYQEATGPAYPPQPMPYSQAAYSPGQPAYPLQPPVQPQPNAPPGQMDYLSQPAFNPDYAAPPKTG